MQPTPCSEEPWRPCDKLTSTQRDSTVHLEKVAYRRLGMLSSWTVLGPTVGHSVALGPTLPETGRANPFFLCLPSMRYA